MATQRPQRQLSAAPEFAPEAAHSFVRRMAAVAMALTVSLSVTDALQLAFLPNTQSGVGAGIVTAALAILLHVRHLIYGVRGERPPAGAWTLAALALVMVAGAVFAGDAWLREFNLLAVSIVIVIPGPWALLLAAGVVVSPLFLVGTQWFGNDIAFSGVYLSSVILWRGVTQIVPLRLLAALRALDSASAELEARAVVQTRVRIDTELRNGVGATLQRIIARGEKASAMVDADPASAVAELRQMVRECRGGLTDARRMVATYRGSSLRAELDAAAALLEASGAKVRIVTNGIALDAPDASSRGRIRTAIADALHGEPRSHYVLHVARDRDGMLIVRVTQDDAVTTGQQGSV